MEIKTSETSAYTCVLKYSHNCFSPGFWCFSSSIVATHGFNLKLLVKVQASAELAQLSSLTSLSTLLTAKV